MLTRSNLNHPEFSVLQPFLVIGTQVHIHSCKLMNLCSAQAGEDYSVLVSHLQSGDFQKADDETRALLIRLAGPDAVKRGWVYFTEVSCKDLTHLTLFQDRVETCMSTLCCIAAPSTYHPYV